MLRAYAEGGSAGPGGNSQNRPGANAPRNFNMPQRRGQQSMSDYYRTYGQSQLGGNARTRGRITTVR